MRPSRPKSTRSLQIGKELHGSEALLCAGSFWEGSAKFPGRDARYALSVISSETYSLLLMAETALNERQKQ